MDARYRGCRDWEVNFENEFGISTTPYSGNYRLIEGLQPYVQRVGKKYFKVYLGNKRKQFLQSCGCTVYANFDNIAFLVKDWIKIQDSLEMIFNLLTGSSERSLEILAYLRKNKIPACSFAYYLYKKHKVILVNRKDSIGICKLQAILDLIKYLYSVDANSKIDVLIIGKDKKVADMKKYTGEQNVNSIAQVVHPSGSTLNTAADDYYKTWYKFNIFSQIPSYSGRNPYKTKKQNFQFSYFHCL